jgi:hypothetical protein
VYSDHADENQFWVLPGPVRLRRREADDRASLTFIAFRGDGEEEETVSGGFLMMETDLRITDEQRTEIMAELGGIAPGTPRISIVPYNSGTVECIALDLQGDGGTEAETPPAGGFQVTERIFGATEPALAGNNAAAFSLSLSEDGAQNVYDAFEQGGTPVGVIYKLEYTALRPALDVKITADLDRVYTQFSAGIEGQYSFVKGSIDAAFEKLVADGTIEIEVINFSDAPDRAKKEEWALTFFKEELMEDWFEPSLDLGKVQGSEEDGGIGIPDIGSLVADVWGDDDDNGSGDGASGEPAAEEPDPPVTDDVPTPERQDATLRVTDRDPDSMPDSYGIEHSPASEGTTETFTVGGDVPVTVAADGRTLEPQRGRQYQVDVPHGETVDLDVRYTRVPAVQDTFRLFFSFEDPGNHPDDTPPQSVTDAYVNNSVSDPRFLEASGPSHASTSEALQELQGAEKLRAWVRDHVVNPSGMNTLRLDASGHASYEGDPGLADRNMLLTERRLHVAQAIVGSLATLNENPQGFKRAKENNRVRDPNDRVVEITGVIEEEVPQARITAELSRPAQETPGGDGAPPENRDEPDDDDSDDSGGNSGGMPSDAAISFRLKFVRQEERKTVTLRYNRAEAVTRKHNPQGFVGLLVEDLDRDDHFIWSDTNDPFFQRLEVDVEAPIDFESIGLLQAHVHIEYGDDGEPETHVVDDFVFRAGDTGPKTFRTFLDDDASREYTVQVQYHFDPASGWVGEEHTIETAPEDTSDTSLLLNPHQHVGFLDVELVPHEMDEELVDHAVVDLTYEDPSGWRREDTFMVRPDDKVQHWKVRSSDPDANEFTYTVTYHLADGSTRSDDPVTTKLPTVLVGDPFERPLEIELIPFLDPERTRMVFVDVEYHDEANGYHRTERIRLTPDVTEPKRIRFALLNPDHRTFSYRFTFLGTNGDMSRLPRTETEETILQVIEPEVAGG